MAQSVLVRRLIALVLLSFAAPLACGSTPCGPAAASPPGTKDVIVQLFQWNWASVARECHDFLGPRGYGGVQVSPPQEHVVLPGKGFPWWQDYQPVSYKVDTRRGNRAAFASMVSNVFGAFRPCSLKVSIRHHDIIALESWTTE